MRLPGEVQRSELLSSLFRELHAVPFTVRWGLPWTIRTVHGGYGVHGRELRISSYCEEGAHGGANALDH